MLISLGSADCAVQAVADTNLRIGPERGVSPGVKAADGGQQAQHSLLEQVLAVPSCQKQGAGTGASSVGGGGWGVSNFLFRLKLIIIKLTGFVKGYRENIWRFPHIDSGLS